MMKEQLNNLVRCWPQETPCIKRPKNPHRSRTGTLKAVTPLANVVTPNPLHPHPVSFKERNWIRYLCLQHLCISSKKTHKLIKCTQEVNPPWRAVLHLSFPCFCPFPWQEGKGTLLRCSYFKDYRELWCEKRKKLIQFPWQLQSMLDHNLHGRWKWYPCNQISEVTEKGNGQSSNKTASDEVVAIFP